MKILMLAPLQNENFKQIEDTFLDDQFIYPNENDMQASINECDIIVGNPSLDLNLYQKNIKAILLNSAGSDSYIKEGLLHPQTLLTNASGTYGKAIAEHTIGMILSLNKNLKTYAYHMNEHLWKDVSMGKELYQSTVLIVGLGDLGYEIAKRLKAFECHIIAVKRTQSMVPQYVDELYTIDQLDSLLPQADYVILTLPQTPQTIHMFNKKRLLSMKKDAMLINVGRGSAICSEDLVSVLSQGHLYGAALDVVEEEPLTLNHPLWDFDNVLLTPHASGGYVWRSARDYFTQLVIRNIEHLKKKEPLENEVDFQTGYRKHISYQ